LEAIAVICLSQARQACADDVLLLFMIEEEVWDLFLVKFQVQTGLKTLDPWREAAAQTRCVAGSIARVCKQVLHAFNNKFLCPDTTSFSQFVAATKISVVHHVVTTRE
jgi:hypothetical protein